MRGPLVQRHPCAHDHPCPRVSGDCRAPEHCPRPDHEPHCQLEVLGWDDQSYPHYVHITVSDEGSPAPNGADLAVEAQVVPQGGKKVAIHIEVHNVGDVEAAGTILSWYGVKSSGFVDKQTVISVAAGGTYSVDWTFTCGTAGAKGWAATASAQPPDSDINHRNDRVGGSVTVQ